MLGHRSTSVLLAGLATACSGRPPLLSSVTLAGVTVDQHRQLLTGVAIEVRVDLRFIATDRFWSRMPLPDTSFFTGRTDFRGSFQITVRRGPEYEMRFHKQGYRPLRQAMPANTGVQVLMTTGEATIDELAMPPSTATPQHGGAELTGRLLDAGGAPIAGHPIVLDSWRPDGDGLSTRSTRTDADGVYSFAGLGTERRCWVRTILTDGTPFELGFLPAPGDLGESRTGPRTSFSGFVVDADRKPVASGRVHVLRRFPGGHKAPLAATDAPSWPIERSGQYRVPGLPVGEYELTFLVGGAPPATHIVTALRKVRSERLDAQLAR